MIGAISGDIVGSRFEANNYKGKNFNLFNQFSRFTDDTVLTCATAYALLTDRDYAGAYRSFYRMYPARGYGSRFQMWAAETIHGPYGSWGNGSAMRVSPIAWAFDTLDDVLEEARRSAEVSHNHPEGIKGAQCVAAATFMARQGKSRQEIKTYITEYFGYNLDFTLDDIRPTYQFDASCQGSVPQAVVAFIESEDFEDAVRNAISIGGDSDTIGAMTGAIAEAFYGGIPQAILKEVWGRLDKTLREVVMKFCERTEACEYTLSALKMGS